MAKVAITEQYLIDIADAIRTKTGMSSAAYYPSEMASAILTISGSGGITPSGTLNITENGTYNVTQYANASVNVPVGSTINNQNKIINPTESQQLITADSGYTGLGTVTVEAISSTYVGSDITTNPTPTVSGAVVTIPSGYYSTQTTKSVASGTAGTPTASKGTVSNHSINITPSVTNTTGYITGSTKTGTAITVSASELVSGNKAISANGTNIDVTNYATVSVDVPSSGTTINNQNKTATPTESEQEITYDNDYTGLGTVTIGAISSTYVGSGITQRSSTDLTTSGATVTVPAGYYSTDASKSIASGSIGNYSWSTETTTTSYKMIASYPNFSAGYISSISSVSRTFTIQEENITPSETQQIITPTTGNHFLSKVTIDPISPTYVGSGITQRSSSDLTASSATVTVPAGYYASQATKSVSSLTLPTSTAASAASGYTSKATITPSTSDQYLNIGTGYNSTTSYYKISAMTTMTLPTSAASSATSGYTSKATIGRSTSAQYINIPPGYNNTGAYYVVSAVVNGSATGPTSLSGSSATVTTGTNTITLTKTGVTTTPTVSAGYVSSATASTATVALTASVTTKAAATITPGTTNQTIAAGTYLTGTQTIAGDSDLTAANIKTGVQIFGVTGTYTSDATASASDLLNGETAYVNGSKITGSLSVTTVYTGSSAPSSSTGSNGDIYIQS